MQYYAFSDCYRLVEVITSNESIDVGSHTISRYAIAVHQEESKVFMIDDFAFYAHDGTNYLINYLGNETEITLPESCNGEDYLINDYAFYDKNDITVIDVPGIFPIPAYRAENLCHCEPQPRCSFVWNVLAKTV